MEEFGDRGQRPVGLRIRAEETEHGRGHIGAPRAPGVVQQVQEGSGDPLVEADTGGGVQARSVADAGEQPQRGVIGGIAGVERGGLRAGDVVGAAHVVLDVADGVGREGL